MRLRAVCILSLVLAFAAGGAFGSSAVAGEPGPVVSTPAATENTPSPDEIYSRAVHEMRALAAAGQPPYLVFDLRMASHNLHWYPETGDDGLVDWEATLVHANETSNYRVWYRSKDQRGFIQDAATHAAYVGDVPFVPETGDMSDFTGAKRTASPSPGASPSNASAATAQVIGTIAVNGSSHYSISLVGVEPRGQRSVYHLHLRAYRDPEDYPLTDLWVDTADYRVWGAHGEVTIRAVAAGGNVGVSADFAPVDKYWLVSDIDVTLKGYVMLWHASTETVMHASVLDLPATLPSSYFSPQPEPSKNGRP